jgi:hypothetical protein
MQRTPVGPTGAAMANPTIKPFKNSASTRHAPTNQISCKKIGFNKRQILQAYHHFVCI